MMLLGGIFPAAGISGTFMAGPSKFLERFSSLVFFSSSLPFLHILFFPLFFDPAFASVPLVLLFLPTLMKTAFSFSEVGYAPAYVILNSNPLLVSFFGIFVWKVLHHHNIAVSPIIKN